MFYKEWLLVLNNIEKKCSELDAIFKLVKINFGSKNGALVSSHIAILQSWKIRENLGRIVIVVLPLQVEFGWQPVEQVRRKEVLCRLILLLISISWKQTCPTLVPVIKASYPLNVSVVFHTTFSLLSQLSSVKFNLAVGEKGIHNLDCGDEQVQSHGRVLSYGACNWLRTQQGECDARSDLYFVNLP